MMALALNDNIRDISGSQVIILILFQLITRDSLV